MLFWLLVILLFLAFAGGGAWGYPRYGYVGYSPFAIIFVAILLIWAFGGLR